MLMLQALSGIVAIKLLLLEQSLYQNSIVVSVMPSFELITILRVCKIDIIHAYYILLCGIVHLSIFEMFSNVVHSLV